MERADGEGIPRSSSTENPRPPRPSLTKQNSALENIAAFGDSIGSGIAHAFGNKKDDERPSDGADDGHTSPLAFLAAAAFPGLKRRATTVLEPTFTTNPHNIVSDRVVIAMVGLPARGKSYISKAIVRYLSFLGCPAQIFNAGNKRRDEGAAGVSANFFDASNLDAKAQRERMAMDTYVTQLSPRRVYSPYN